MSQQFSQLDRSAAQMCEKMHAFI